MAKEVPHAGQFVLQRAQVRVDVGQLLVGWVFLLLRSAAGQDLEIFPQLPVLLYLLSGGMVVGAVAHPQVAIDVLDDLHQPHLPVLNRVQVVHHALPLRQALYHWSQPSEVIDNLLVLDSRLLHLHCRSGILLQFSKPLLQIFPPLIHLLLH